MPADTIPDPPPPAAGSNALTAARREAGTRRAKRRALLITAAGFIGGVAAGTTVTLTLDGPTNLAVALLAGIIVADLIAVAGITAATRLIFHSADDSAHGGRAER